MAENSSSLPNYGSHDSENASSPFGDAPQGYPKFAELMNIIPETAVFRRFGALNALKLLYLQAELTHIERSLRKAQVFDHENGKGKNYAKNWFFLKESGKNGDGKQLELIEMVCEKLEKYNEAIVQQEKILSMKSPDDFDMNFIRRFIASEKKGLALALTGLDSEVWGSDNCPQGCATDLIALRSRHNEDGFSKWVTGKCISKFFGLGCARFRKESSVHGFVGYHESELLRITYNITSILASALPIASIAVLAYVDSMRVKLGIIAAFNIILSLCMTALTTAKKTEIFAVAAAFSAVQVVFIQGGMNGGEC